MPAGEKRLSGGFVLEDTEDADLGGNGLCVEHRLDVILMLELAVELLERPPAGEDAVTEFDLSLPAPGDKHLCRDDQDTSAKFPLVAPARQGESWIEIRVLDGQTLGDGGGVELLVGG